MSLKFLCPSFRTRYRRIMGVMHDLSSKNKFKLALNIGCGEGDYDFELKNFCEDIYAGDINETDVSYAKLVNKDPHIHYQVLDVEDLNFKSDYFDCVLCIEVLEHVNSIDKTLVNIKRVLKKNGIFLITVPSAGYPWIYDPLNKFLEKINLTLPIGAYAYGHKKLIHEQELEKKLVKEGFSVVKKEYLSSYLVGFLEMYWAGLVQKLVKHNSKNKVLDKKKMLELRPKSLKPSKQLTRIVDWIIDLDHKVFKSSRKSIGTLWIVKKV